MDPVAEQDALVAKVLADLVRTTIANEWRHARYHSERPPCAFLKLKGTDAQRDDALVWCRRLDEAVLARLELFARGQLRALGVSAEHLATAVQTVMQVVRNVSQSERGRWLFGVSACWTDLGH